MSTSAWAVLGGLVGILATWVLGRSNANAQRVNMLVTASTELIEELRAEIARLRERIDQLEFLNRELRGEVAALRETQRR